MLQLLLQQLPLPLQDTPARRPQLPAFLVPAGQQTAGLAQVTQVRPPVPQIRFVLPGWQTPFWQQPFGQLVELHTHEPFTQVVPEGQVRQTTPPVPQCWLLLVWQVLFWQHPFGQLVGVHKLTQLPFWHVVPVGQATQTTPPVPQAAFVLPVTHWLFWQHPLGQLAGVHTHEPP